MRPLLFPLLVSLAACQTFPGFLYQTGEPLVVDFNGTIVDHGGQSLGVDQVQSAPTVGLYDRLANDNGPFMYLYIDPSPYGDNGTLDALQMLQTDLTLSDKKNSNNFYALTSNQPPVAPYIAPDPIVGPPTHHYTLLLFRQPANFSIPAEFRYAMPLNRSDYTNRIGFKLPQFVRSAGLELPVASMYFDVSRNGGSSNSSSSSSSNSTSGSSTSTAHASAAVRTVVSSSVMLLLGLVGLWIVGL